VLLNAFTPQNGATGLTASTTVAASNVAASGTLAANPNNLRQVRVLNASTSFAYVNFGGSGLDAATVAASMPILPQSAEVFTVDPSVTTVSVILNTGTGNVIFTRGEGV